MDIAGKKTTIPLESAARSTAAVAAETQNHLAEEALLANPDALKNIFQANISKLDPSGRGTLDHDRIRADLSNPGLTGQARQMLEIFDRGYDVLARAGSQASNDGGINLASLRVITKALNDRLPDDPIREYEKSDAVSRGALVDGVLGGIMGAEAGPIGIAAGAAIGAGVGAVLSLPLQDFTSDLVDPWQYNHTSTEYKSFVRAFKANKL